MVEPITYFCASGPVTSVCFHQTLKLDNCRKTEEEPMDKTKKTSLVEKTLLLAGTGNGTLSCWDLKSCNIVQVTIIKEIIFF
jgi:hypothetical protein